MLVATAEGDEDTSALAAELPPKSAHFQGKLCGIVQLQFEGVLHLDGALHLLDVRLRGEIRAGNQTGTD